jgi:hypothetical protein
VTGLVVLLAIVGVAFALLRHNSPPGPIVPPPSSHPATSAATTGLGPVATVRAYFAAINARDFSRAWALGGKNTGSSSYSTFVSGFKDTAKDHITIVSVAGNVVTVKLAATQTDGSVQHYQGTYTVTNGIISQGEIQLLG